MTAKFLFATGIENSNPTIDHGRVRMDELEKCGHYRHWRRDFDLVQELEVPVLRYGPPIHLTWRGAGRYDWTFADETFQDLRRRKIMPVVDLCHFGLPDWLGNFQNPDFPALFANYAQAFAQRFPWVQLYTPVNEMYVCARFSGLLGMWNEQLSSERAFVTALKHLVKANVLAIHAILSVRPDALFIQSESTEHFHPEIPAALPHAEALNAKRFLSLDLNYGRPVDSKMYEYLLAHGMTKQEYHFFLGKQLRQSCIMGNDYYNSSEYRVAADGRSEVFGEAYGYYLITKQYYERYHLPVMHTETNFAQGPQGNEAVNWLWKQWSNILRLRNDGVPVAGFTWYSLTDQVDWDTALRENNGRVNPLGLCDLDRNIRPVGLAYRDIIRAWGPAMPTQALYPRLAELPLREDQPPKAPKKAAAAPTLRPT